MSRVRSSEQGKAGLWGVLENLLHFCGVSKDSWSWASAFLCPEALDHYQYSLELYFQRSVESDEI